MKKHTCLSLLVVSALFVNITAALAISSNNDPFDYLVKGKDLSRLSMGVYGGQFNRDIEWDNSGIVQKLKSNRFYGYLGVDVIDWLTLYATAGMSESAIEDSSYGDFDGCFGAGFHINFLTHYIREPVLTSDIVRFNFEGNYLHSSADLKYRDSVDWDELNASFTIELVNNTTGIKFYSPESISLYVGPIFSALISDDFSEDNSFGVIGGIQIFVVDTVAIDIQVQHYGQTSVSGGLNYRF
jgi:opacity protein-like surface antigen